LSAEFRSVRWSGLGCFVRSRLCCCKGCTGFGYARHSMSCAGFECCGATSAGVSVPPLRFALLPGLALPNPPRPNVCSGLLVRA
jgi:hypothetical protein